MAGDTSGPTLIRPTPRRPFELSPAPTDASHPGTSSQDAAHSRQDSDTPKPDVSRSRSVLNLTASTLFGIYAPTGGREDASPPATPWGTGAETPSRHASVEIDRGTFLQPSRGLREDFASLEARLLQTTGQQEQKEKDRIQGSTRTPRHHPWRGAHATLIDGSVRYLALFVFGLAYGGLVAHLHDHRHLSPVKVEAFDRSGWMYLGFWGTAGVALGSLLPWIDSRWRFGDRSSEVGKQTDGKTPKNQSKSQGLTVRWNDVVRSVGAFVGVAFAIRKLPWSSPLQLSLTLALTNPFLWYLLDRTSAGFTISSIVGILGTVALFAVNPSIIPSLDLPSSSTNATVYASGESGFVRLDKAEAVFSQNNVGVATWIASVLFCSCVCFGNIGRLLVPSS